MESIKNLKLFVGGYFDERIFEGDKFIGKTPYGKDIDTYTLNEVLQLGFLSGMEDYVREHFEVELDDIPDWKQTTCILHYLKNDEYAGLEYFETEAEAEKFKQDALRNIEWCEENAVFLEKRQIEGGFYVDVLVNPEEQAKKEKEELEYLKKQEEKDERLERKFLKEQEREYQEFLKEE